MPLHNVRVTARHLAVHIFAQKSNSRYNPNPLNPYTTLTSVNWRTHSPHLNAKIGIMNSHRSKCPLRCSWGLGPFDLFYKFARDSTDLTSSVNLNASKNGSRSSRASSCGSFIQPSIGIPFSALQHVKMRNMVWDRLNIWDAPPTLIQSIRHWWVVYQENPRKVWVHNGQVFNICSISVYARLEGD